MLGLCMLEYDQPLDIPKHQNMKRPYGYFFMEWTLSRNGYCAYTEFRH